MKQIQQNKGGNEFNQDSAANKILEYRDAPFAWSGYGLGESVLAGLSSIGSCVLSLIDIFLLRFRAHPAWRKTGGSHPGARQNINNQNHLAPELR